MESLKIYCDKTSELLNEGIDDYRVRLAKARLYFNALLRFERYYPEGFEEFIKKISALRIPRWRMASTWKLKLLTAIFGVKFGIRFRNWMKSFWEEVKTLLYKICL